MTCSQCQAALPNNAAFCTQCGTPVAAAAAPPATAPPGAGAARQAPPVRHAPPTMQAPPIAQGWTGVQGRAAPATAPSPAGAGTAPFRLDLRRLTAADRTIGVASLLTFIALFLPWFGISVEGVSFSESGMSAHGYLAIVLILSLAIVIYLVLRAGWDRLPMRLPVAHAPLLLLATGLQLLIVLIAFLLKPGGLDWYFGAYLGLAAAIAACVPIAIPAIRSMSESRR
jgi:zinc-ribbon domain